MHPLQGNTKSSRVDMYPRLTGSRTNDFSRQPTELLKSRYDSKVQPFTFANRFEIPKIKCLVPGWVNS